CFFFSSRRRHTRSYGDWSSDVCSSDLTFTVAAMVPTVSAPTNDMTKAIASASKAIGKGGAGIPGTMASRVGGTARAAAMQMNGGDRKSVVVGKEGRWGWAADRGRE